MVSSCYWCCNRASNVVMGTGQGIAAYHCSSYKGFVGAFAAARTAMYRMVAGIPIRHTEVDVHTFNSGHKD